MKISIGLVVRNYLILVLITLLACCAKPFRHPPFDETTIEMISEYNYVLEKNIMTKGGMTESRAEEYLFKSIMRDVISLCKGNDRIDEMTYEFGWGLDMPMGIHQKS